MRLEILLPTQVCYTAEVTKVTAESENGYFTLLPRHIDFVTALVPGLLFCKTEEGQREFFAVNSGVLVKCGPRVLVSTPDAIRGPDLGRLKQKVREQFHQVDEREQRARSALVRLEADFVRRFLDLQGEGVYE